jgi:dienelactone hydrolase
MGLRPLFDDLCRRLADEHGWAVCAVEPFPGREHLSIQDRFEVMSTIMDEEHLSDLNEGADLLVARAAVDRVALLHGGHVRLEGRGHWSLRSRCLVLRHDPAAR